MKFYVPAPSSDVSLACGMRAKTGPLTSASSSAFGTLVRGSQIPCALLCNRYQRHPFYPPIYAT